MRETVWASGRRRKEDKMGEEQLVIVKDTREGRGKDREGLQEEVEGQRKSVKLQGLFREEQDGKGNRGIMREGLMKRNMGK